MSVRDGMCQIDFPFAERVANRAEPSGGLRDHLMNGAIEMGCSGSQ